MWGEEEAHITRSAHSPSLSFVGPLVSCFLSCRMESISLSCLRLFLVSFLLHEHLARICLFLYMVIQLWIFWKLTSVSVGSGVPSAVSGELQLKRWNKFTCDNSAHDDSFKCPYSEACSMRTQFVKSSLASLETPIFAARFSSNYSDQIIFIPPHQNATSCLQHFLRKGRAAVPPNTYLNYMVS